MNRYETLMLARPDITGDELSSLQEQIENALEKSKAKLLAFDRWGKYRLAYPVQKNTYGVYVLIRYEGQSGAHTTAVSEVDSLLKLKWNDHVMRFVTRSLEASQSLLYQKPDPVDGGGERTFEKTMSKIEASLKESPASSKAEPVASEEKNEGEA